MIYPTVISRRRIIEFLFTQGIGQQLEADELEYVMPSKRWFYGTGAAAVWPVVRSKIPNYKAGQKNCGDFTEVACDEYHQLHRDFPGAPDGKSIAIGRFKYVPDEELIKPKDFRSGHAIIFAITSPNRGETLELNFAEPQSKCQEVDLSLTERNSCLWIALS